MLAKNARQRAYYVALVAFLAMNSNEVNEQRNASRALAWPIRLNTATLQESQPLPIKKFAQQKAEKKKT